MGRRRKLTPEEQIAEAAVYAAERLKRGAEDEAGMREISSQANTIFREIHDLWVASGCPSMPGKLMPIQVISQSLIPLTLFHFLGIERPRSVFDHEGQLLESGIINNEGRGWDVFGLCTAYPRELVYATVGETREKTARPVSWEWFFTRLGEQSPSVCSHTLYAHTGLISPGNVLCILSVLRDILKGITQKQSEKA